jgi:hypothetical protein
MFDTNFLYFISSENLEKVEMEEDMLGLHLTEDLSSIESNDLYDALDRYCEWKMFETKERGRHERRVEFQRLPPVLNVHLPRVRWSRDTVGFVFFFFLLLLLLLFIFLPRFFCSLFLVIFVFFFSSVLLFFFFCC